MKIVVTVEFDGRDPVAQMIKMFGEPLARSMEGAAVPQVSVQAVPSAEKRTRGRPFGSTKPKPEVQPVGVVTPVAVESVPAVADPVVPKTETIVPKTEAPALKLADVQTALERLYDAKGAQVAIGTLSSLGVTRARDLSSDQYPVFMERVEAILKA